MRNSRVETDHLAQRITSGNEPQSVPAPLGASLLFAPSDIPSAAAIDALLSTGEAGAPMARISYRPADDPGWLELLASGLTFDMSGLAERDLLRPRDLPHAYGFEQAPDFANLGAVELVPGGHIAGGSAMPPVVRTLAGLAASMALQMPVAAVGWHSAGTVMAPTYFARLVMNWLRGGAFPALGLTALIHAEDGIVSSHGLATFAGQEFRIQPGAAETPPESVKLALRVADHMVRYGPFVQSGPIDGLPGLIAEPSQVGKLVWVWRPA